MTQSPLSSDPHYGLSMGVNTASSDRPLLYQANQRLKKPSDFSRVYRSKQWGGSKLYTYNVSAIDLDEVKLGITVSKKVSKSAVVRNRIKRQIKEFYRLRQHQLFGAEVVITAKPACSNASDQERLESLEQLWGKLLKWRRWQSHQQAQ